MISPSCSPRQVASLTHLREHSVAAVEPNCKSADDRDTSIRSFPLPPVDIHCYTRIVRFFPLLVDFLSLVHKAIAPMLHTLLELCQAAH